MAQRLAGEPTNSKFDTKRSEKEVTTTTEGTKTRLDTNTALYDKDGNLLDIQLSSDGNVKSIKVNDLDQSHYSNEILKELKKINLQLSILTDNMVNNTDIE